MIMQFKFKLKIDADRILDSGLFPTVSGLIHVGGVMSIFNIDKNY